MPRPALGSIAVGDRVIVTDLSSGRSRKVPARVEKVGRVWVDLAAEEDYRTWRMRLDNQTDGGKTGVRSYFDTPEQHEYDQRQSDARGVLRAARITLGLGSPWDGGERLLALAEFVRSYNAQHPAA